MGPKIDNIHPSFLPLFPGLDTHKRAIDAGCRVHGCSVHFVTEGMDEGPIISQAVGPIAPNDTIETLSTRILKVEHQLYPRALAMIANGQVYMGEDGHSHFNDVTMTDMDQQLIS
jgi:phosphoribosylglycinamide formyltransferase-1